MPGGASPSHTKRAIIPWSFILEHQTRGLEPAWGRRSKGVICTRLLPVSSVSPYGSC
jgi:hypothetical protein